MRSWGELVVRFPVLAMKFRVQTMKPFQQFANRASNSLALWWAASAIVLLAQTTNAQTYPSQPVRLIVPFTAGTGMDTIARAVAPKLAQQLGQGVVVQSRDTLLCEVWGDEEAIDSRSVDTYLRRLRAKLGEAASHLRTVRGLGYRLVA